MKTDILKFGMTFVIIAALMWCSGSRALGVMLQFSLDGMNPAPEEIVVSPGDIIPMNVVSYTSGENYIRVIEIVSPPKLSPEAEKLLRQFQQACDYKPDRFK